MTKRVLYIWYKYSRGIPEGGGQVSSRNYRMVCQAVGEENVENLYIHDERRGKTLATKMLSAPFFLCGYYYGLSPRRVRAIVRRALAFDCVFIDRSLFGQIARGLRSAGYQGRIIAFFHNYERTYFDARLSRHLPFRGVVLRCAEINDRLCCQYADRLITLTQRDSDLLEKNLGRAADAVIPVSMQDVSLPAVDSSVLTRKRPVCIFLGSYFRANNEAILWFIREVLPHVDIRMRIVGRGMARLQQERPELKSVEVLSDVPDLQPVLLDADLVILPVFTGSGMKVKTCESLLYGRNILGTDEAFAGYELDDAQVGARCNTATEFIAAIRSFAENPRPRFNIYARNLFLQRYSNEAVQAQFKDLLR